MGEIEKFTGFDVIAEAVLTRIAKKQGDSSNSCRGRFTAIVIVAVWLDTKARGTEENRTTLSIPNCGTGLGSKFTPRAFRDPANHDLDTAETESIDSFFSPTPSCPAPSPPRRVAPAASRAAPPHGSGRG